MRPAQPSRSNRTDREDHERHGHRLRRFVHVVLDLVAHARGTVEGQIHEAEHVERSHQRGAVADKPEDAICAAFRGPGLPQDFVFREEAGEGKDTGDGQRRDQHRLIGGRNALTQIAHVAHVLLATQGMNHRTGTEEEQRLEECVSEDVEDARGKGSDAERQEHVSQLRDGGVGEHALDVVLHQSD